MKNILKKTRKNILYLLCISVMSCCTDNSNQQKAAQQEQNGPIFPDEVLLYLCNNVVEDSNAAQGIENAYNWIWNGTQKLNDFEMEIDKASLLSLRDSADKWHNHATCTGSVTGLKTFVGLHDNNLTLFFQPIYMCASSASSATFTVGQPPAYLLVYEAGKFRKAVDQEAEDTSMYRSNIKFQEPTGPRPFNPSYDVYGDTRALMIPFQVMMALMYQNQDSQSLKIFNFAERLQIDSALTSVRQSLLLGAGNVTRQRLAQLRNKANDPSIILFGPFSSKYADRANICPPRCSAVTFSVAQNPQQGCQE